MKEGCLPETPDYVEVKSALKLKVLEEEQSQARAPYGTPLCYWLFFVQPSASFLSKGCETLSAVPSRGCVPTSRRASVRVR